VNKFVVYLCDECRDSWFLLLNSLVFALILNKVCETLCIRLEETSPVIHETRVFILDFSIYTIEFILEVFWMYFL